MCGIKNHGNTCFMNAILQCLSHTDLLADYFVMNHYKIDLMKHDQLNLCKYGSHGEVTAQCALLFKSLRTNTYSPDISSKFKYLVSKYCKQYEGNEQHDAQEFLFCLLDIFHEDLNIATKKKAKKFKIPNTWNKPDEIIAAETLSYHTRCDNSFIRDIFQAQLRSSLVCRSCKNQSNTFDPYMCLSLPVPSKRTHINIVNVSYLDKVPKKTRMAVTIEAQATLREMRHKISRLVKVPECQLVLLVKNAANGMKELAKDKILISELLDDMDEMEAIEIPKLDEGSSRHQMTLVWTNRVGIGSDNQVFGPFFSCIVRREASFKEIQLEMLKCMQPILRKACDLTVLRETPLFRLKVVDGISGRSYLPEDGDHPLYTSTVNEALSHCKDKDYRGPLHIKLIVEWDLDLRQTLLVDDEDMLVVVDDPNMEYVIARNQMVNEATLEDCFDMYFREEKLGADDAWMCPYCKKRQQCIKKLSLWSIPHILIVHLKRFRQASNIQRTKLATMVYFPLTGLDMNPYLSKRSSPANDDERAYILYPWRKNGRDKMEECHNFYSEDNIYDLYAVCNHHGTMQSGHYTAYCRDLVDHQWYCFDDHQVTPISEKSVLTGDAYILFYQRSNYSSGSISKSSSNHHHQLSSSQSNNSFTAMSTNS